jgi:hypothetical protein
MLNENAPCRRFNFAFGYRLNYGVGVIRRERTQMRSFARRSIDAALGAITITGLGLGMAAAADIPPLQGPEPPGYYGGPPANEGYAYPPPAAYGYPPPAYYYAPPAVAVVPAPYYPRYYYGGVYASRRGYWYGGRRRW